MIRFVGLALFLSLLLGCDRDVKSSPAASQSSESATSAGQAGPSIYPLGISLRDQDDRAISLDVFRGHPVIVSMFYASCPSACPLTISRIQSIERALDPEERANLRVLLVSFDPAHDTSRVLRDAADAHGLDARWALAAGSADDVRTLAGALGVTYTKLPDGGFSHNSVLVLADDQGQPVARVDGVNGALEPITSALAKRPGS